MTWTGKNEVLEEVISRSELERMLDEAGATYTSRRIPAGAMVFWSGEPDGNHYYLESGSVELFGVDAAGRKKVIDRYGPGMFFGFHILRDTNLTMSTAQCLEDSRILAIPKESFFKLLRGGSEFSEYCVRYLFGLLSMQTNEMLSQSFYATAQRVPMLLSRLAAEQGDRAGRGGAGEEGPIGAEDVAVFLPYSNNDIADMLGVSRNSVTTVISRLQSQGIVEKQRNAIRVLDPARLADIARREQE